MRAPPIPEISARGCWRRISPVNSAPTTSPEIRVLDHDEQRPAIELPRGGQEPAAGLSHRLGEQRARDDRPAGKVVGEDVVTGRKDRVRDRSDAGLQLDQSVDEYELHGIR